MYQTVRELARLCELHLIVLLDFAHQRPAHEELDRICASTQYLVRPLGHAKLLGSIEPHAVREFRVPDLGWLVHRQIYTRRIDVVQLEYTVLGQYAARFRRIANILFEHDVYFQSIARRLPFMANAIERPPLGIFAVICTFKFAHAAVARSHPGMQPRQRKLSLVLSPAIERADRR